MSSPGNGGDIDDHTAPLLPHNPANRLDGQERTGQVDVQGAPPVPFVQVQQRCVRFHASVVDQDIDATPVVQDLFDHHLDGHLQGDVGDIILDLSAGAGDTRHGLIQVDRGDVIGSDCRALCGEGFGNRPADTPPSPGNQSDPVSELAHVCSLAAGQTGISPSFSPALTGKPR